MIAAVIGMQVVCFLTVVFVLATLTLRLDCRQPQLCARTASTLALFAASGFLCWSPRAEAAHVVYSPIVEEGEIAVEFRGHHDFDSRDDVDGSQQFKVDLEYTPTSWWRTEVFGEWEKGRGESLEATEVAWENVLQITPQGKYWMDFGVLAEYARSLEDDAEDALELGLLGEKQFASTVLTANLSFEREFASGAGTEMKYAARYRWRVAQAFEPGIEIYGDLGDWGDNGQFSEHELEAGPAVMGKFGTGTHSAFKYEAAVLLGLTDEAPDTTFRFLLEYEF